MATQVGEATIKLSFDGKTLNASLANAEKEVESGGKKSGSKWGDAWSVAAGNLISSGIGRVTNAISNNMDRAVERLDTVMNAQHVFEALGYSADDVSKSMSTLDGYLDGLPTSLTQAVQGVQTLSASFGGIELGTQAFIDLNNAGLAFGATSEDIEGAIMQLSQLDLNGPLNAETWNSLQQRGFQPVFAAMAKEAGITVGELKESFGNRGDKTVKDFLDTLHRLGTEGSGDMKSFADLARENTNGVGTAMENVQNRIGKAMEKILEHIGQENISNAINTISYAFSDVADAINTVIDFITQNEWVQDMIIGFLTVLAGLLMYQVVPSIIATSAALLTSPLTWIILGVTLLIAGLVALIRNFETVKQVIFDGLQAIGVVFSDLWNGLKEGLAQVGEFFKTTFQNIWNTVTGIFGKIGGFFEGVYEKIKYIFQNIGQKVGDSIKGIIKGAVNGVLKTAENILNGPIRAVNAIIDVLNAIPGVDIGKLNEISLPRMAKGGLVDGATTAIIGEAGAEAVIPLERNTENWTRPLATALAEQFQAQGIGGAGVTVYMTNNINNNLDADEIGQRLITSIRRAS